MSSPQRGGGLDPAIAAHLADPRNDVRPPPAHVPLAAVRAAANGRMREAPRRPVHQTDDLEHEVEGRRIRLRLYRPSDHDDLPVVLFAHGGGWVWGDLESHDGMCRHLSVEAEAAVLAVDYRLSPETPFPGPLDDVAASLRWLIDKGDELGLDTGRIALAGDSSGGNLALGAARLAVARGVRLAHLALLYPALDPACDSASHRAFGEGYLLTNEAMRWFWSSFLGPGGPPPGDLHAPLAADLAGLPPTTIVLAGHDVLRDEGLALATALREAGVPVRERLYPSMIHGFASLGHVTPVAAEALDAVASDIHASFRDASRGTR